MVHVSPNAAIMSRESQDTSVAMMLVIHFVSEHFSFKLVTHDNFIISRVCHCITINFRL